MKKDDPVTNEGEIKTRNITKVSANIFIKKCDESILNKYPHKGTCVVYPRQVLDTFGATWVRLSCLLSISLSLIPLSLSNPSLSLSNPSLSLISLSLSLSLISLSL